MGGKGGGKRGGSRQIGGRWGEVSAIEVVEQGAEGKWEGGKNCEWRGGKGDATGWGGV